MRLCLNKNIAIKKNGIWQRIVRMAVRNPICNSLKSLIILICRLSVGLNVFHLRCLHILHLQLTNIIIKNLVNCPVKNAVR